VSRKSRLIGLEGIVIEQVRLLGGLNQSVSFTMPNTQRSIHNPIAHAA
jgi:hypothetical protein